MTNLTGTRRLVRLILRRDRAVLPIWVIWLGVIAPITASAFRSLYPSDEVLAVAARGFAGNPGFRAMFGPVFALNLGGLTAWRASIVLVVVAVVSLLSVIRHTRVEEETGRRELIGSTVVGRHAPLAAALIVVAAANLAAGAITAVGLIAQGLEPAGSVALAVELVFMGVLFAGVGAVAAQITESAGAARAIGLGALALAYAVRAAGDAADAVGWLSWLSPMGWIPRVQAFHPDGERWLLPLAALALATLLGALAFMLSARRDVGGGLVRPRTGPAQALPSLRSPLALAWRLHRGLVAGWAAGFLVLGALYGSVAPAVGDMLRDNPDMAEIFERLGGRAETIIDLYLTGVTGVLGLIAAGYGVHAALRMRVEEESLRLDPVLATATTRDRWLAAQLVMASLGPATGLIVAGVACGVAYGAASGDLFAQVPRVLAATLVQLPAVWLLGAIAVALFGGAPRFTGVAWGVFGGVVFITFIGALLGLGQWFLDLSPFTHVPALPGADFEIFPVAALLAIAAALVVVGAVRFRGREIG